MARIYLLSPEKIDDGFFSVLGDALSIGLVAAFQLRLKGYDLSEVEKVARRVKKICHENNCLFILNDFLEIALKIGADGIHVGADDVEIAQIRSEVGENFIIGSSCYDSRDLALRAVESGASYVSFGAFFESRTKKSRGNPKPEIIDWAQEMLNVTVVAIGGIDAINCAKVKNADLIAVISCIWSHKDGAVVALKELSKSL